MDRLHRKNFKLTAEEILSGKLEPLLEQGLQVVTICNNGTGRSKNVAHALSTTHHIPSIHMDGGLTSINENADIYCQRGYLFSLLNQVPELVVILTHMEIVEYLNYLNQLYAIRFTDSQAAILSMMQILKNADNQATQQ